MRKNKFQRYREAKGYNQESMCTLVGMPRSSYSSKERGHNEFTFSEAYRIATCLDITLENMFEMLTKWENF